MMQTTHTSSTSLSVSTRWFRRIYTLVAWLFVACLIVQVFLAGMSVFTGSSWWDVHIQTGHIFGIFTILLALLSLAARFPRLLIVLSFLLIIQYALQYAFINLAGPLHFPALSALHPVNAMLLFLVAVFVGTRAVQLAKAGDDKY